MISMLWNFFMVKLTGALTTEYSGDGVHVKAAYYPMWRDYLFEFGVVR